MLNAPAKFLATATALAFSLNISAHEAQLAGDVKPMKPDGHAPIGVMADHMHKRGEWMLSLRSMTMTMKGNLQGNLQGSDSISPQQIVTGVANSDSPPATVRVVPLKMTTRMHMLGLMYAPSDSVTLMAMVNYLDSDMDHRSYLGIMGTNSLGDFTTRSRGFGDTRVSALWRPYDSGSHKLHLNLGVSLPTGSIDESDDVLTPMDTRPTLRLIYTDRDAIDGRDDMIAAPVTTANPDNYGGERLDIGVGINLVGQNGTLRGHRLALEYTSTLDQDVNGVQMEMQSMLTMGYQYAF